MNKTIKHEGRYEAPFIREILIEVRSGLMTSPDQYNVGGSNDGFTPTPDE